jgi:ribosomal protein S18 acetylase RimI-like enzyme
MGAGAGQPALPPSATGCRPGHAGSGGGSRFRGPLFHRVLPALKVELRAAEPADEEFLFRVYASTREDELREASWDGAQKEKFLRMQFGAQASWYAAQHADASFDVVVVDGEPAGRLYVHRGESEIRIIDISLLPEHRGRGIGSSILGQLLAEADEAGKRVTIHVERFNPALRLYERLGFSVAEDKGVYLFLERPPAT